MLGNNVITVATGEQEQSKNERQQFSYSQERKTTK